MTNTAADTRLLWYAMSSPYGRELKAEAMLERRGVLCFVPKERVETISERGTLTVRHVPLVRNLIFVRSTEADMRRLKPELNTLIQFKTRPEMGGRSVPIIVPDKQMDDFLRIFYANAGRLTWLTPDDISSLRPNARVIIGDGIFRGVEGYLQRIAGHRARHFIVRVDNLLACATTLVNCRFVKAAGNEIEY